MTPPNPRLSRVRRSGRPGCRGFTLIELLVVIAIMTLLIGILLPALQGARRQAKDVRVRSQLKALDSGLEMFQNDFYHYPQSAQDTDGDGVLEDDPVSAVSAATNPNPQDTIMYGAHYLARAMVGRDLLGYADPLTRGLPTGAYVYELENGTPKYQRYGPYLDTKGITLILDDPDNKEMQKRAIDRAFPQPSDRAKELMFLDFYGYPILYYRAEPLRPRILREDQDKPGVYDHVHNEYFTGTDAGGPNTDGWQYEGQPHPIAVVGTRFLADPTSRPGQPPDPPRTFEVYIYDPDIYDSTMDTSESGGRIWPYNADSYLLITAGYDGLYGTRDDVKNFAVR